MAELVAVTVEHTQNRHLLAFWGLRVVVAVVGVTSRGQKAQVAPATLAREAADPVWVGLRDHGEGQPMGEMRSRAVERVQDRRA
jgi:hypothetical protein